MQTGSKHCVIKHRLSSAGVTICRSRSESHAVTTRALWHKGLAPEHVLSLCLARSFVETSSVVALGLELGIWMQRGHQMTGFEARLTMPQLDSNL